MESNKNQYGLLLPKKTALNTPVFKKPAVFDSESDEESNSVDWISETAKKEKYGSGKSRQVKADMEKVLKDDPTVYQYDEVYDDMKKKKDEAEAVKKNDKKPRYMGLLIKQAERRKREDERRKERQIQKEREAEGDTFADKEIFITSSYKKKLEELRKMDEEDKRMERLEDIGDVTKQCDLNGFYRHLYETMNSKESAATDTKPTPEVVDTSAKFREVDKKKARNIRKRVMSDEENDSGSDKEDTSSKKSKSSDVEDSKPKLDSSRVERIAPAIESKTPKQNEEIKNEPRDDSDKDENGDKDENDDKVDDKKDSPSESAPAEEIIDIDLLKKKMIPARKSDIWIKRTVGEVFEAALLRYRERKESVMTAY